MADNDDDDLDAFFDDVENAVKEVQEEEEGETAASEKADIAKNNNDTSHVTATKDVATYNGREEEQQRPAKRVKVTAASSVPVKSIVASSVPVISINAPPLPSGPPPSSTTSSLNNNTNPPPPPPPPAYNNSNVEQQQPPPPLPPNPNAQPDTSTKPHVRSAAGTTWSDPTLIQWPTNDFRLFVGNLAKDLKQHHLEQHFSKYNSFHMARIMYNKTDGKSRGYGFVSLLDAKDCARAIREMDQSWLGSRPIKVKLSEWKDREYKEVKKKGKYDKRKKKHFGL